jgi:hypothetical protein
MSEAPAVRFRIIEGVSFYRIIPPFGAVTGC